MTRPTTSGDALGAERVIGLLGLQPLDDEGGRWAQTWIDAHSSAIYFLLQPGDFSAFHRLSAVELYHWYGGAAAELWMLHPDGSSANVHLGMDLDAGERPVQVVPAGSWQGSRTLGAWSLLGCTMAPPYRQDDFELGARHDLLASHPARAAEIEVLTRSGPV